jgi:hypothetical protein
MSEFTSEVGEDATQGSDSVDFVETQEENVVNGSDDFIDALSDDQNSQAESSDDDSDDDEFNDIDEDDDSDDDEEFEAAPVNVIADEDDNDIFEDDEFAEDEGEIYLDESQESTDNFDPSAPTVVMMSLPVTGEPRVDDAIARLADLSSMPVDEHVAVFEDVQRRLHDTLADLSGQ